MRPLAIAMLAGLLAACATQPRPEPQIITQEVLVPVVVSCIPDELGERPEYDDTDAALLAAPDGAARYVLLQIGRAQRVARLAELEAVTKACRTNQVGD